MYRRLLVALAAAVVCAQAVVFLPVNLGFPHFVTAGKPTLVSALHHLGGFPRRPTSVFLRKVSSRIGPGPVLLVSADHSGLGRFFRVQAAYDLFPHKAYFGRGGPVAKNVAWGRGRGARYVILIRKDKGFPWPTVRGSREIADTGCCRLATLAQG